MQKTRNFLTGFLRLSKLDASEPSAALAQPAATEIGIQDEPSNSVEIVTGEVVGTTETINLNNVIDAKRESVRLRRKIEEFDEDKQAWSEFIIIKLFTGLAYTMPVLTAWFVGMAIGDAFSGSFNLASSWSLYAHAISIFFEMCLPMLGLAVTKSVKRAVKDKSQVWVAATLSSLFIILAIGNAFATIYLVETHINLGKADMAGHISVWFRSFGPLVIDVSATIFLSVVTVKNLSKYLQDMQAKAAGIQSVARSEIAVEAAFDQAAIDRENARVQQERTRMDNEVLKQLTMRRNEETLNGGGRHGRW
jgi:hypothetical protein